ACAARALLGGGARDAHGLEPAHAASGVEACTPSQARIDDDAYPLDREARLRDVRCEHDFASSRCARSQRFVLKLRPELAVKRKHAHVRRHAPFFHEGLRASDLALSGKEHEDIAGFLLQGAQGERRRTLLDARRETRALARRFRGGPADLDGIRTTYGRHDRRIAGQRRKALSVELFRHTDDSLYFAKRVLAVETEREPEVRMHAAFVKFVEDDEPDAFERRI